MRLTGFLSVKPSTPPRRLPITNRVCTRWIVSMGHGLTLKPSIKFCYWPGKLTWTCVSLVSTWYHNYIRKSRKIFIFSFVKIYKIKWILRLVFVQYFSTKKRWIFWLAPANLIRPDPWGCVLGVDECLSDTDGRGGNNSIWTNFFKFTKPFF